MPKFVIKWSCGEGIVCALFHLPFGLDFARVLEYAGFFLQQCRMMQLSAVERIFMFPKKFEAPLFSLVLSGLMSLIITGIATLRIEGWGAGFVSHWFGAWPTAWAVAFPSVMVVAPIARKIVGFLIRKQ